MEDELNYLSEKIEEVERERDYYESECKVSENEEERAHFNDYWTKAETDLELLRNILNTLTIHALT